MVIRVLDTSKISNKIDMSKGREQREGAEMKRHVSAEEALEVMQPLSASELQDSSEEDTSFKGGLTQNAHWSLPLP